MLRVRPRLTLTAPCWLVVPLLSLAACQKSAGDDDDADHGAGTGGAAATGGGAQGGGSGSGVGGVSGSGAGNGGATSSGGTSGNGGSGGTGAAGGGSGGGGGDPCATAIYCDDFEKYTTGLTVPWTPRQNSGTVALDRTEHVSGAQSVKFSTQAAGSVTAMMRLTSIDLFPIEGNVVYGRMLYKVASTPTSSVHWTMIQGLGVVPGQTYHAEYRYGGQQPIGDGSQLMANYETPDWYQDKSTPGSDCWHHANGRVMPVGRWVCVEWKFDGPNAGMQMWLDGQPASDLTVMGTGDGCVNAANDAPWTAPTFAAIDLGWESYQTDEARTAWVDDVVISTTPIGCP